MIYLRDPDVLFLKARKVAGTSFEIALSKFAGPEDIITRITPEDENLRASLGFRGAQNYMKRFYELTPGDLYRALKWKKPPEKYFHHIGAELARKKLGSATFDKAHKIAIVRNPYDILVSQFHWVTRGAPDKVSFPDWVSKNEHRLGFNNTQYLIDDRIVIDHFIRYENLLEDIGTLEEQLPDLRGLAQTMEGIRAKGGLRPKSRTISEYYNGHPDVIEKVETVNKLIIEKFGYTL